MRVAVYSSILYGEDFVKESIESIAPYVDRIFVVMMSRPWGGTDGLMYKGEWIPWPQKFDNTRERIEAMNNPAVTIIDANKHSPWDRWSFAVELVRMQCSPDEVVLIDPDCVYADVEARNVFEEWDRNLSWQWAAPGQVELWRTPAWQVVRPRSMTSFHRGDLSLLASSAKAKHPKTHTLSGRVHNFGFCCSVKNTRWKHLTAMAFSPIIGESCPNPDWFDKTWRDWHPTRNNRNLEVSLGSESAIPCAVPYDTTGLPESIKRRYAAGEWPTFEV